MVTLARKTQITNMMQNPACWPLYPYLPLTHRREFDGPFPKLGVLVDGRAFGSQDISMVVFLANVGDVTRNNLSTLEHVRYDSYPALLNDWQID